MTKALLISSYVCLLSGILGSIVAAISPYWMFISYFRTHLGIFFITDGKQMKLAGDFPRFIAITYALGLAVCLVNIILSSVQVCCRKFADYKMCYASGYLGLLSVSLLAVAPIYIASNYSSSVGPIEWALMLAIVSSVVILVAAALYFVTGSRKQNYVKLT